MKINFHLTNTVLEMMRNALSLYNRRFPFIVFLPQLSIY